MQEGEGGEEIICSFCQGFTEAPMSELRCGHQVHTECLIIEVCRQGRMGECADCHITMLQVDTIQVDTIQVDTIQVDTIQVDTIQVPQTVAALWANNEEFRNDVKEYKKLNGKAGSTQRVYAKELSVVKNRFKQNILTSIEVIKDQQRQATAELNRLQSRKIYRKAGFAIRRKLNHFRSKWDVSSRTLRELNDIQGAPKISYKNMYYRWRCSPKYIFRIRI
jgi:hypothetical protein